MTQLELQRKLAHQCTRCGVDLEDDDDTYLCETHRLALNARRMASYFRTKQAKRMTQRRLLHTSTPAAE